MSDITVLVLFILQLVVFVYFIIVNGTYTLFTIISLKDIRTHLSTISNQSIRNLLSGVFYRPLSIIVPAHNEQENIVTTVKSLLSLSYPEYEVIVVDDGSSDSTLQELIRNFRLVRVEKPISIVLQHEPLAAVYASLDCEYLTVISKKNGGKSDALNAGINFSRFPLICSIDADSLLENDALLRAARLFVEDKEVVATGGIVRVLNGCSIKDGAVTRVQAPKKGLECFQAVEYTRSFLSGRTSWNFLDSLLIISGAFAIFRKDMVMAIKGYRKTVGEDMDIVVRLHRHCRKNKIRYKILFVPDPVCWTQVPGDLVSLLKQRNRWHRGLIDSLWKNRGMLFNPRYGKVGFIGYPYFLFIEALGPVVEFFGYCLLVVLYFLGWINREFVLLFFFLAILWGMWLNLGSIMLDNMIYRRYGSVGDLLKLFLFGLLEFLGYRQLIVVERFIATILFWKKEWGKPKRQEMKGEIAGETA
jgi:cellulose synthase/poly-beta-1,6-N-acetylglucosamine synthase-like glycosyltransferase